MALRAGQQRQSTLKKSESGRMRARLGTLYSKAVSRFVSQVHCRLPAKTEKQLYLTFDDGPTLEGTPELLDVLSEYDVRATFFLVGENAARYPAHVRELVARGHAIGGSVAGEQVQRDRSLDRLIGIWIVNFIGHVLNLGV